MHGIHVWKSKISRFTVRGGIRDGALRHQLNVKRRMTKESLRTTRAVGVAHMLRPASRQW